MSRVEQRGHLVLKDIEERFAVPVGKSEFSDVINEIKADTFLNEGLVDIPPVNSPDFTQVELNFDKKDLDMLKNDIKGVFTQNNLIPKYAYVLSEEESISEKGLTKFPFNDAIDWVVSYIGEWGQLTDYWLTDGKQNTVTFHRSGVVYWKNKKENLTHNQVRQN